MGHVSQSSWLRPCIFPIPSLLVDCYLQIFAGDDDGDGIPDHLDNDDDNDGIPDDQDNDDDGDGIPDVDEGGFLREEL